MKRHFGILLFCFVLALCVNAQTVKTTEARQLHDVERRISSTELQLKVANTDFERLRKEYKEDALELAPAKKKIADLTKTLAALNMEKKELLTKQLTKTVPNNSTELMKLIVIQNERIIDLLEKLVPSQ